jgi:hypothetical protein
MAESLDTTINALIDNADFEEVNSLAKAKAFITAAKRYLISAPRMASDHQGHSQQTNPEQVKAMMDKASEFVSANETSSTSSSVRFLGVGGDFR